MATAGCHHSQQAQRSQAQHQHHSLAAHGSFQTDSTLYLPACLQMEAGGSGHGRLARSGSGGKGGSGKGGTGSKKGHS